MTLRQYVTFESFCGHGILLTLVQINHTDHYLNFYNAI